jgi:hypothetical protein
VHIPSIPGVNIPAMWPRRPCSFSVHAVVNISTVADVLLKLSPFVRNWKNNGVYIKSYFFLFLFSLNFFFLRFASFNFRFASNFDLTILSKRNNFSFNFASFARNQKRTADPSKQC